MDENGDLLADSNNILNRCNNYIFMNAAVRGLVLFSEIIYAKYEMF
jgi:hypothetical protein